MPILGAIVAATIIILITSHLLPLLVPTEVVVMASAITTWELYRPLTQLLALVQVPIKNLEIKVWLAVIRRRTILVVLAAAR